MTQPSLAELQAERIAADAWGRQPHDPVASAESNVFVGGAVETQLDTRALGDRLSTLQRLVEDIKGQLGERPVVYSAQVYGLDSTRITLKSPITVVVERYEGEVLVRFPELELTGVGRNEPQAFQDFREAFAEFYDDLTSSPKRTLGPLPLRWLTILDGLVRRNA
jgi:hypothetical protein